MKRGYMSVVSASEEKLRAATSAETLIGCADFAKAITKNEEAKRARLVTELVAQLSCLTTQKLYLLLELSSALAQAARLEKSLSEFCSRLIPDTSCHLKEMRK
jgi:hypothetical protein